jgi:hypothetical protein
MKSFNTTTAFMEACYLLGLSFYDEGDILRVTPKELITQEIRQEIKRRKPVILLLLKSWGALGEPCKVCGWRGETYEGWCEWCIDPAMEAEAKGCELILCLISKPNPTTQTEVSTLANPASDRSSS